jgi:PBP1b-binding outer membrane lipoprotein LpoB
MRRSLIILALLLAGCGGDGTGPTAPVQHVPEISNLKLAPSSVEYMTGDGQAAVMAELGFADAGHRDPVHRDA